MITSLTSKIREMKLRDRIDHAMQLRAVNQTELARLMGVTPQAVQKWLSQGKDRTTPRMPKIKKVAEVLRVPESWLLSGEGVPDEDAAKKEAYKLELAKVVEEMSAEEMISLLEKAKEISRHP